MDFSTLTLGMLLGAWPVAYGLNRYYRSEIWEARKKVQLEQIMIEQKEAEVTRTKKELEISDMLDERIK